MPTTLPKTIDFFADAPIAFEATRRMPFDADTIFDALADTPNWPKWFPGISQGQWTSEAPFGVGSTRKVKAGPIWFEEVFIAWEPGKRWGFTFTSSSLPVLKGGGEMVELTPDGDATRVRYRVCAEPYPLLRPFSKMGVGSVNKLLGKGLDSLQQYLASQA